MTIFFEILRILGRLAWLIIYILFVIFIEIFFFIAITQHLVVKYDIPGYIHAPFLLLGIGIGLYMIFKRVVREFVGGIVGEIRDILNI